MKERMVLQELIENGYEHIQIDGAQLGGGSVREDDVRAFCEGLRIDKVSYIHYLPFKWSESNVIRSFMINVDGTSASHLPMQPRGPRRSLGRGYLQIAL